MLRSKSHRACRNRVTSIHRAEDNRPKANCGQIKQRVEIPDTSSSAFYKRPDIKLSGDRRRQQNNRVHTVRCWKFFENKQSNSSAGGMANEMNRLPRIIPLIFTDEFRDTSSLSLIVAEHRKVQRIPWPEFPPVDNLHGMWQLPGDESSRDAVVD